ncbi:FGGY-family carbohydrate kinase [Herbiconiux liukaitaii]|uniref:FGGY-family carbohydrate kinase n=1 Tax=Herbiconiux liukaitaii TaxID=3342799 RepID=UPI0035B88FE6
MLPTITVDVGTTSVKLSRFDASGRLTASRRAATPTRADAWGAVYDVDALRLLLLGFIADLAPAERAVTGRIALTGVGESGGLVRPDLTLASPMILWHDQRGAARLERLTTAERAEVYAVTGLPVNANYGLSKVAWALERSASGDEGAVWLNVSEYLAAVMTGRRWSEYSLASRTMALDLRSRTWSAEICALLGLDVSVFPELRAATEGSPLSADFAAESGLSADTVVHVAGHDHMVGAVGASLAPGELLNSTGTTEGLLFLRSAPSLDDSSAHAKLANGIACTGPDYTVFASIPTGGSAFATLQSLLGVDARELGASIGRLHEQYLAGSLDPRTAPLVLPRFRGSPPPDKIAAARGIVAGLGSDATSDDLVFGCFLGMVLQFRDVLELFGQRPDRIKVIGPAGGNPLWLQLKADLLATPLSVSTFPEVVSRGAQALASGSSPGSGGWETCAPHDVEPDARRSTVLREWSTDIRPQWEHLKATPVGVGR